MAGIFLPSTHSFYNHRKTEKCSVFLSTPSVFLSPWQRGSLLIMRKLNSLVPKQPGNKPHAHLGPGGGGCLSHTACFPGCQGQTRGGQARRSAAEWAACGSPCLLTTRQRNHRTALARQVLLLPLPSADCRLVGVGRPGEKLGLAAGEKLLVLGFLSL